MLSVFRKNCHQESITLRPNLQASAKDKLQIFLDLVHFGTFSCSTSLEGIITQANYSRLQLVSRLLQRVFFCFQAAKALDPQKFYRNVFRSQNKDAQE